MKRILCLMLCLLVLFSGCTFGQPAPTEGTTVPSTEATEKEHKAPIIGSTEGYEQGEDEWEDDHEETQKPTEKNEYSESADGEGTGVAVSEAVQSATMNYYFMAGEGGRYDPDDHFTRWGDSCLLVFPNGKTMLIDTGLKTFYSQLKAKLADLQVSRLDYVVFTHPHDDHCGALWAGLLTDFSIGQVYHNGLKNSAWGSSAHIATMCSRNNIPCSVLKKGDSLTIGDVTMKVLWPGDDVKNDLAGYHDSGAINNQSLVLRFDYGEHSSLFTGDLYKTYKGTSASAEQSNGYQIPGQLGAEERIAAMYTNGELDVDLLKLPHHGDPSTSNSAALFGATTPEIAVATAFQPLESGYTSVYKSRGLRATVLFDRKHGFIHITATSNGNMQYETSRSTYLPNFGRTWNDALERA